MATPKKNIAYEFSIPLIDKAVPLTAKVNPTIASGDFKVSIDNGAFNNLTTLPTIEPVGSILVRIQLSSDEMNGDKIVIWAKDVAGAEWEEVVTFIDVPIENIEGIAAAVWDEILTGATHNISTSAGKRLRSLAASIITQGTTISSTVNTIVLNGDASSDNGAYDPAMISIVAGVGMGQTRGIVEYDGDTKTAVVDRNWKFNPDGTSEYIITGWPGRQHVNEGLARGGDTNTIILNTLASSANNAYNGQLVFIRSGTGEDQIGHVIAYDGTTKIATISPNWVITPDTTSVYIMIPFHLIEVDTIVSAVWAYVVEGTHTAVGFMRLMVSALRGKSSGGGTSEIIFRDIDDSKDRITATVDSNGNRTAVTSDDT